MPTNNGNAIVWTPPTLDNSNKVADTAFVQNFVPTYVGTAIASAIASSLVTATTGQIWDDASGNLFPNVANAWSSVVPVNLGSTGSVTVDMSTGINFQSGIVGNVTLSFANLKAGQGGIILIEQNTGTTNTVSLSGNVVVPPTGLPAANTGAGANSIYFYYAINTSFVAVNKII